MKSPRECPSAGAVLARANNSNDIYLIDNGQKRHVMTPDTMTKYHFKWTDNVQVVAPILLSFIPTGILPLATRSNGN